MKFIKKVSFPKRQYAYSAGRSTETALHKLVQKTLDEKDTDICAFLNISGAFDNTPHDAIKRALEGMEMDKAVTRWIGEVFYMKTAGPGSALRTFESTA